LAESKNYAFYKELARRGKSTPLSDMPEIDAIDRYYLSIIIRLRKMTAQITLQDIAAYCQMFPVEDKARLIDVVSRVTKMENANVN
jgi:hypothetical protein